MEADLQKKLQSSWSSGAASNAMSSSSFVDEVRLNWNKYEKNIKMRTLLSLLGVENSKRTGSNAVAIKKLLKVASEDKTDKWIPVIAGLVCHKLHGNRWEEEIESFTFSTLEESVTEVIQKMKGLDVKEATDTAMYFQPLELRYLCSELSDGITKDFAPNSYFKYSGTKPDFIKRERSLFAERQKAAASKWRGPSLASGLQLNEVSRRQFEAGPNSSTTSKGVSSASANSSSRLFGVPVKAKHTAQAISIEQVRSLREAEELESKKAESAEQQSGATKRSLASGQSSRSTAADKAEKAVAATAVVSSKKSRKENAVAAATAVAAAAVAAAVTGNATASAISAAAATASSSENALTAVKDGATGTDGEQSSTATDLTRDQVTAQRRVAANVTTNVTANVSAAEAKSDKSEERLTADAIAIGSGSWSVAGSVAESKSPENDPPGGREQQNLQQKASQAKSRRSIEGAAKASSNQPRGDATDSTDSTGPISATEAPMVAGERRSLAEAKVEMAGTVYYSVSHTASTTETTTGGTGKAESAQASTSTASAAASASAAAAAAPGGLNMPNLEVLFAESPLLRDEDKAQIVAYFSEAWRAMFPPTMQAAKIKLQESEKLNESGARVKETIFLQLDFSKNERSWRKTKKTKEVK